MSDASSVARSLRERLSGTTDERLGTALSDLLENPILTGAIGRAFDAREKALQAQELAMGALNIPSATDIERLTRRLRSVSLRLDGIEEGVDRLEGAIASPAAERSDMAQRLSAIEGQLERLTRAVDRIAAPEQAASGAKTAAATTAEPANAPAAAEPANALAAAKPAKAPAAAKPTKAAKATKAAKRPAKV